MRKCSALLVLLPASFGIRRLARRRGVVRQLGAFVRPPKNYATGQSNSVAIGIVLGGDAFVRSLR
jgi:hypothetical protein